MQRLVSALCGLAIATMIVLVSAGISGIGARPASATPPPTAQCNYNSDCAEYLSCKGAGYCMAQCQEDRDCGPGNRCVVHLWDGYRDVGLAPVGNVAVPSNLASHKMCVTANDATPIAILTGGVTVAPLNDQPGRANTNMPGSDYRSVETADAAQCATACQNDSTCKAWTFVKAGIQGPNPVCWLKNRVPESVSDNCCTSGVALQ